MIVFFVVVAVVLLLCVAVVCCCCVLLLCVAVVCCCCVLLFDVLGRSSEPKTTTELSILARVKMAQQLRTHHREFLRIPEWTG